MWNKWNKCSAEISKVSHFKSLISLTKNRSLWNSTISTLWSNRRSGFSLSWTKMGPFLAFWGVSEVYQSRDPCVILNTISDRDIRATRILVYRLFRPPPDRSGISVYVQAFTKQLCLDVNDYGVKINSNWSDYSFRFLIPVNYELTPVQISDKDFLRSRNYTELINVEFIKLKAIIRSNKFSVLLSVTVIRGTFDLQRLIHKCT